MSSLRNKVQLIGNLGQDPEVVNIDSGKKVAKLSLATKEEFTNASGEKISNTDWHNLVAWGNLAGVIEKYVCKGDLIAIEGKLKTRSYDDKEGKKRYVTEVVVNDLVMLGNKKAKANENNTMPEA